jgi:hypothetical protein
MKIHVAMLNPPDMRKAPEKAQVRLVYMSLGVIAS